MLETYSFSGDPRVLERVRAAINAPEVQALLGQWSERQFVPGHAVCAYEQIRLPALFYLCTGEPKYRQASLNAFQWFQENHMLPYGVTSGEEYLSGIGAFRLTETCDVAARIWSTVWLYRVLGSDLGRPDRAGPVQRRHRADRARFPDHVLLPVAQPHPGGVAAERAAPLSGPRVSEVQPPGLPARALLRRHRQSHRPQLRDPHVDGHRGPRAGGDALRPLQGVGPGRRRRPRDLDLPDGLSF